MENSVKPKNITTERIDFYAAFKNKTIKEIDVVPMNADGTGLRNLMIYCTDGSAICIRTDAYRWEVHSITHGSWVR